MGRSFISLVFLLIPFLYPNSSAATTLLSEDFSDNSAGWILDFDWQIGAAMTSSGHSYGNADPAFDHTPTADNGLAGVIIGGNAPTSLHSYYNIASPVIDANVADPVIFEYWRWLNSDYTPFMANRIQVFDGVTWNTLWESGPHPGVTDTEWTQQIFDISAYKNSTLQLRFGYQIASTGAFTVSSWNIDDVSVYTLSTPAVPLPAAVWLFGSVIVGLAGFARKRRYSGTLPA